MKFDIRTIKLIGRTDKVATALSVFIGGWVLEFVKYVPDQVQSPKALLGIKLF